METLEYKLTIPQAGTVNKMHGLQVIPDKNQGNSFYISELYCQWKDLESPKATGDAIALQLTKTSQNGQDPLDLDDDDLIRSFRKTLTFTQDDTGWQYDPAHGIPIKEMEGVIIPAGKKTFFNILATGQAAVGMTGQLIVKGNYSKKNASEYYNNALGG